MILRRKFNGAKLYTEAWEHCYSLSIQERTPISSKTKQIVHKDRLYRLEYLMNNNVGRRASYAGRGRSESGGGLHTSENAGLSSENYVRIIMAERLRF